MSPRIPRVLRFFLEPIAREALRRAERFLGMEPRPQPEPDSPPVVPIHRRKAGWPEGPPAA